MLTFAPTYNTFQFAFSSVEIYLLPNRMRKSGRQSGRRRPQQHSIKKPARSRSMVQRPLNAQNSSATAHLTRLPPVIATVH